MKIIFGVLTRARKPTEIMAALSNVCDLITKGRAASAACTQLRYNLINELVSLALINYNQIKDFISLNLDHMFSCIMNKTQCNINTSGVCEECWCIGCVIWLGTSVLSVSKSRRTVKSDNAVHFIFSGLCFSISTLVLFYADVSCYLLWISITRQHSRFWQ